MQLFPVSNCNGIQVHDKGTKNALLDDLHKRIEDNIALVLLLVAMERILHKYWSNHKLLLIQLELNNKFGLIYQYTVYQRFLPAYKARNMQKRRIHLRWLLSR